MVVTATGNLEPTNEVDVGSELSSILKSVDANYDDKVEVGQILPEDLTQMELHVDEAVIARAIISEPSVLMAARLDPIDTLRHE